MVNPNVATRQRESRCDHGRMLSNPGLRTSRGCKVESRTVRQTLLCLPLLLKLVSVVSKCLPNADPCEIEARIQQQMTRGPMLQWCDLVIGSSSSRSFLLWVQSGSF